MTARVPLWLAALFGAVALAAGLVLAPLTPWAQASPAEDSAEVGFARDMRVHHAQAVAMSVLAFDRTNDPQVRAVALDIATTQQAQIGIMGAWLEQWGQRPSSSGPPMAWMGHDMEPGELMPGMASREEMAALSDARGPEFDRQWATLMHAHHRGGLPMTEAVLAETELDSVRALAGGMRASQASELMLLEEIAERAGGQVGGDDEHGEHSYH
jgi:uncharacterized protein (DUF305 family)